MARHACGFLGRIEITSEQNRAGSLSYITTEEIGDIPHADHPVEHPPRGRRPLPY